MTVLRYKITICATLFVLMLMLGWGLEQTMSASQAKNSPALIPSEESELYSEGGYTEIQLLTEPFLPRQYARIRRMAE